MIHALGVVGREVRVRDPHCYVDCVHDVVRGHCADKVAHCRYPFVMTTAHEIRVVWEGWSGGPGYSIFYTTDVPTMRAALGTFIGAVDEYVPGQITLTVENEGRTFEAETGTLTGYWSDGVPIVDSNAVATNFAASAGLCINWLTAGVVGGRPVRGRTFLVPLTTATYDQQGTILVGALTAIRNASDVLAGTAAMRIWSRPRAGINGSLHAPVGARINDRVSMLRSRAV